MKHRFYTQTKTTLLERLITILKITNVVIIFHISFVRLNVLNTHLADHSKGENSVQKTLEGKAILCKGSSLESPITMSLENMIMIWIFKAADENQYCSFTNQITRYQNTRKG